MGKIARVRVHKRGKTYSYVFEAMPMDGARKRVERGGFPDAESAYSAGIEAFNDMKHGNIGITSPDITLSVFLDNWMKNACAATVRDSTWQTYHSMIKNNIKPKLGGIKLQDLTPAMLDLWVRKLALEGKAYKSICLNLAILRRALGYAVFPGQLIPNNPVSYIRVPKNAPKKLVKRTIVTPQKMEELMEAFPPGHFARIPTLILYHTGVRIGEAVGLTWDNIDFSEGTITIDKQIRYINRSFYFRPPKTDAGARTIYTNPVLLKELQAWKEIQAVRELEINQKYKRVYLLKGEGRELISQSAIFPPPDTKRVSLICTKEDGGMLNPDVLRWQLRQHDLNSHSFRHTQATILVENGASPKSVAGRLGQSSVVIAQDIYTHETKKMRKDAADIFYNSGAVPNGDK